MSTPQQPQPARRARLVVTEQVCHQLAGEQPAAVTAAFARVLESDEEPYSRRVRVGELWAEIDCGWLERAGMVVIANERERRLVQPTAEQRAEEEARVVEVANSLVIEHGCWLVPPGETFRGMPADVRALRLRCRKGEARVTVTVFPA